MTWRKRSHLCAVGGNVNGYSNSEKQYRIPQNIKNRNTTGSNSSIRYLPKVNKNTNSKRYTHPYVNYIIYYGQGVEAT